MRLILLVARCVLTSKPISAERRAAAKPVSNAAAYVDAVRKNVADLVSKRFIVREDGEALLREAQKSPVP